MAGNKASVIKVPAHAPYNFVGGKRVMKSIWNQSSVQAAKGTISDEELKKLLPEEVERKFRLFWLGIPFVFWANLWLIISTRPLDVAREMLWTHMYDVNFKENEEENEGWVDVKVTEATKVIEKEDEGWVEVEGEDKYTEELRQKLKKDFMTFLQRALGAKKAEAVFQK